MATIVTIHGTNATGEPAGDKWWQRGSQLQREISRLVGAKQGQLRFEPFIWSGDNSERDRRAAGARLLDFLFRLESTGEKYCLIGHSHGGSVIASALLFAASRKAALPNLARWITIGTPFITTAKEWLLFLRLGNLGKTIYLSLACFAVFYFVAVAVIFNQAPIGILGVLAGGLSAGIPAVLALAAAYVLALYRDSALRQTLTISTQAWATERFGARWQPLNHKDDEATRGLHLLSDFHDPIFNSKSVAPSIILMSLGAQPILLLLLLRWTGFMIPAVQLLRRMNPIAQTPGFETHGDTITAVGPTLSGNVQIVLKLASALAAALSAHFTSPSSAWYSLAEVVLIALVAATVFVFFSLLVLTIFVILSRAVSSAIAASLNRLVWQRVRQIGFGYDVGGEFGRLAGIAPQWLSDHKIIHLPDELGDTISEYSNNAAARSVGKFRSQLGQLALARRSLRWGDFYANTLTWGELIHTSYFDIPEFRRLLAYAICESDGFCATRFFAEDQHYDDTSRIYNALRSA